jgi:hypothetical protein
MIAIENWRYAVIGFSVLAAFLIIYFVAKKFTKPIAQ